MSSLGRTEKQTNGRQQEPRGNEKTKEWKQGVEFVLIKQQQMWVSHGHGWLIPIVCLSDCLVTKKCIGK